MITLAGIKNVKPENYDEIWAVVRSLKKKPDWSVHVPVLSPSWDLFQTYLRLRDSGNWNKDTFDRIYRPRFLEEMKSEPALYMLEMAKALSDSGKHICMWCFCPDKDLCHRSLLAEILKEMGCEVTLL